MIAILIVSACAPDAQTGFEQLPDPQVQASPTLAADGTARTQAVDPGSSIVPTVAAIPSFDVRLTAVSSGAKVIRGGGNELEVQQDQVVEINVDEGIEVVPSEGQEEQSYSILDFSDNLEVELFSDTSVFLADLTQQATGSTYVNLHVTGGHIFVHLNELTNPQVEIQTPAATIRVLGRGAEFDVCHNEGLSCVFVKKGVVEVSAKNRTQLLKAGEAVHILKDQRPSAPVCAPFSTLTAWEEEYRQFAATPTLEQVFSELPQEPCPLDDAGLPLNARILFQDQFINPFSGWDLGRIGNFNVRYAGLRFFRIQAQGANSRHLASVPKEQVYQDVNIDIHAIASAASGGDFRYGMVFRRTENQYYAFVISPVTRTWYFLKNSANGLQILKEGQEERIDGLDSREMLRVEAYGSTFLLYINGRLIDWVSDSDYPSGEAALFVETIHNPDAEIRFDSIVIWDVPQTVIDANDGGREYCFNTFDDDGDRLADRADPDCQRLGKTATPAPVSTNISANATNTPQQPTNTLIPQPSNTPVPPASNTPMPIPTTRRPTRSPTSPPPTNPPPTATSEPPTPEPPTPEPPTPEPPTPEPPTPEPPTPEPPPTDPPATDPPATDPPAPTDPPTP